MNLTRRVVLPPSAIATSESDEESKILLVEATQISERVLKRRILARPRFSWKAPHIVRGRGSAPTVIRSALSPQLLRAAAVAR